jgi:nucleoside-diphosphate-sugar epimerase
MSIQSIRLAENSIVWSDLENVIENFHAWEFFRGQTILITGGNGLLPSYLVRVLLLANRLQQLGLKVTCIIRSRQSDLVRLEPWVNDQALELVYGEAESYPLDQLSQQSIVIHAASGATPAVYQSNPVGIILPNTVGTARLCEQASIWKSKRFLFFSTGEVYGINSSPHFLETAYGLVDPCSLRSCYAESKRCGEAICVAYSHQYELHTVIARIFHTYGPQMKLDDGRVFADFVRDSLEGKRIKLASSGEALRCFCYLSDATSAFLHLIVFGESAQAYNLSNSNAEVSIRDLATLVAGLSNPPLDVYLGNNQDLKPGYMPSQVPRSLPSIAKMQALGWQPVVGLQDGFKRTLSSYRN